MKVNVTIEVNDTARNLIANTKKAATRKALATRQEVRQWVADELYARLGQLDRLNYRNDSYEEGVSIKIHRY